MICRVIYTFWMLYYYIKLGIVSDIKYCFKKFNPNSIIEKYHYNDIYTVINEIDSYRYVISYIAYAKSIRRGFFSNEYPYEIWCEYNMPIFFMHPNIREFAKDCLMAYIRAGDSSVNKIIYKKYYDYNLVNEESISLKGVINTFVDF